jgi:hypothetical protein
MKTSLFAFSGESLLKAASCLPAPWQVIFLRTLKEAAIYDQSFDSAMLIRDTEKKLTGGETGINYPKKRRKVKS